MDGLGCSDQNIFLVADGISKAEGSLPDVADGDRDGDLVADEQGGFVIGLCVHDGKEVRALLKHGRETEAEFFQKLFIRIMDDGKLVGEKKNAGRVCVVQSDLCFVSEHKFLVIEN